MKRLREMVADYLFWKVYTPAENVCADFRDGVQRLTVGDVSAYFEESTEYGGDIVRRSHRRETDVLEDLIADELRPDDRFLDVGANIGLYSCFAMRKLSPGHLTSVEPYPPNIEQLRRNLALNAEPTAFSIAQVALSETDGTASFTPPESGTVGAETASLESEASGFSVSVVRGDELLDQRELSVPNVVKIDVEGNEHATIRGLEQTLTSEQCRCLYCEVHRSGTEEGYSEQILALINQLGFDIENQWESPGGSATVVKATSRDGPNP